MQGPTYWCAQSAAGTAGRQPTSEPLSRVCRMVATAGASSRNMRHWQMFTQSGRSSSLHSLTSSCRTCRATHGARAGSVNCPSAADPAPVRRDGAAGRSRVKSSRRNKPWPGLLAQFPGRACRHAPRPSQHLSAEAPIDDCVLAGRERVAQDGCAVAAARDGLLQLVDAHDVQGQAHCLLKLAVLVAPAGPPAGEQQGQTSAALAQVCRPAVAAVAAGGHRVVLPAGAALCPLSRSGRPE